MSTTKLRGFGGCRINPGTRRSLRTACQRFSKAAKVETSETISFDRIAALPRKFRHIS